MASLGYAVRPYHARYVKIVTTQYVTYLLEQINYLIGEGMCMGKGGNCVISLLHHHLQHYGLGEVDLVLHADNCSGQNKNR